MPIFTHVVVMVLCDYCGGTGKYMAHDDSPLRTLREVGCRACGMSGSRTAKVPLEELRLALIAGCKTPGEAEVVREALSGQTRWDLLRKPVL